MVDEGEGVAAGKEVGVVVEDAVVSVIADAVTMVRM